jgi:Short C-terminal domain
MPLRRGPGLVRTVGRTAVIAGTATAVSGRVANRQAQKNAPAEPQVQYVEAPAPAAAPADDYTEQLEKLGELHDKGILTDEEFAAKKSQVLGL